MSDAIDELVDWQMTKRPPRWHACPDCRTQWLANDDVDTCPAFERNQP